MRLSRIITLLAVLLLAATTAHAKEQLMVRDLEPQRVDTVTAKALSDIIKSALGEYYSVQSMDALAALSSVVEEKLKAGCDDTKCLIEVAGAMDIGLVATGSISKLGSLYTLNMQLISTRGTNLGVVQRASEKCTCSDEELVGFAERVALKLIGKTSSPPVVAAPQRTPAAARSSAASDNRYTDLGNGIVRDNTTGLMWQQASAPETYSWFEAQTYLDALTLGGYSDWRLPTREELESLVDKKFTPSINTEFFPDTKSSYYWSSTTVANNNDGAWLVGFYSGHLSNYSRRYKGYVRAVRSGQ